MGFNIGIEERRIRRGRLGTRYLPAGIQIKVTTQQIRSIVDDLADNIIKKYPKIVDKLQNAARIGSVKEVARAEKKLIKLFKEDYNFLCTLDEDSMMLETQFAIKINQAARVLEKLKSKAVLKGCESQIAQLVSELQALKTAQKGMWERTGGLVQNQQFKNYNLNGQIDAMRGLLTPMVLDGRVERKLSYDVIGFCDKLAKVAWELRKREANPKALQDATTELNAYLSEINKYLPDDYKALIRLRVNATFLFLAFDHRVRQTMEALRKLLEGGFPQSVEQELEGEYKKIIEKTEQIKKRLMWDENFEDRTVEDTLKDVSRVLDELRADIKRI